MKYKVLKGDSWSSGVRNPWTMVVFNLQSLVGRLDSGGKVVISLKTRLHAI